MPTSKNDTTLFRNVQNNKKQTPDDIIKLVYEAMVEKGYDPVMQIVGYMMSGDPTYITSHKNARSYIRHFERDELLEAVLRYYVENKLSGNRR